LVPPPVAQCFRTFNRRDLKAFISTSFDQPNDDNLTCPLNFLMIFQVDATPQTEADLAAELDKVAKQFGGGKGVDMTKFPEFTWSEPKLEDVELK